MKATTHCQLFVKNFIAEVQIAFLMTQNVADDQIVAEKVHNTKDLSDAFHLRTGE